MKLGSNWFSGKSADGEGAAELEGVIVFCDL